MLSKIFDQERLIHSLKTAIACLAGYVLALYVGFPGAQWIVITIIVVMCAQIYVGSVIQKAYVRFLGTIVGCLFAAFSLILFGNSTLIAALTLGAAAFGFSYFATWKEDFTYAGTLGAVTTTIILLTPYPTVIYAVERFLEISIGLFIATLVSQFILPIHARTHLRRAQAATLKQLHDYYQATMTVNRNSSNTLDYNNLDESIVKSLLKQRQLAKESHREPLGSAFDVNHFTRTLHYEREMLRAITFMNHAIMHVKNPNAMTDSAALAKFNAAILQALAMLSKALDEDNFTKERLFIPSTLVLKREFEAQQQTGLQEELLYVDGFLFSAEIMTDSLKHLAKLYGVGFSEEKLV